MSSTKHPTKCISWPNVTSSTASTRGLKANSLTRTGVTSVQLSESNAPFSHHQLTQKPRQLSLLDDYELIGGVPTSIFRPVANDKWAFRSFAISADGSRLAVAIRPDILHVYDFFDNFSLVAKCDYEWCIDFLEFWNLQNDLLVVVFENCVVSIISIVEASERFLENDLGTLSALCHYAINQDTQPQQSFSIFDEEMVYETKSYWDFTAVLSKGEMWLVQKDCDGNLSISSVCQNKRIRNVKISSGSSIIPTKLHISVPQRSIMATYAHEDLRLSQTKIWKQLDFDDLKSHPRPIVLLGQGVCWGPDGTYIVLWTGEESGSHSVELHARAKLSTRRNGSLLVSREMGVEIISLKVAFLERGLFPIDHLSDENIESMPLLGILVVRSEGIGFLVWETSSNHLILEWDLSLDKMIFSKETCVEFCISPNMRWIGVGCWKDGIIGLFSMTSGALVWSVHLDLCRVDDPCFIPMTFDPSSTRFIINSDSTLYIFAPPCLSEISSFVFTSSAYRLSLGSTSSFMNLDPIHQRLVPRHILSRSVTLTLKSKVFLHHDCCHNVAKACFSDGYKLAILVNGGAYLSIFFGSFETFSSQSLQNYLNCSNFDDSVSHNFNEIRIENALTSCKLKTDCLPLTIFLYPDLMSRDHSIVVFSFENGILGLFVDSSDQRQHSTCVFSAERCFAIQQSVGGYRVLCLYVYGVLIIDLNQKMVVSDIPYVANIQTCLDIFFSYNWENKRKTKDFLYREVHNLDATFPNLSLKINRTGQFDIFGDGRAILLGWDLVRAKPLVLDSNMTADEIEKMQREAKKVAPCWLIGEESRHMGFLEFDGNDEVILAVGTYNTKNGNVRRSSREEWNDHMSRMLGQILPNHLLSYGLQIDNETGTLWLMVLAKVDKQHTKSLWIPIGPYSSPTCLPCLQVLDYPTRNISHEVMRTLVKKSTSSVFNMTFGALSNFQLVVESNDELMMSSFMSNASKHGLVLDAFWNKQSKNLRPQHLLRRLIDEKNDCMVKLALKCVEERLVSFHHAAIMMKDCFEDLLTDYHALIEPMLTKNLLCWNLRELEVPAEIFTSEDFSRAVVWTSDSTLEWKHVNNEESLSKFWISLNAKTIKKIENHGRAFQVRAVLKVFCMNDIGKIGLNGILRFLLMKQVPSHIFKTLLVKSVVLWKWKHQWKKHYKYCFSCYTMYLIAFSVYAVAIGSIDHKGTQDNLSKSVLFLFLVLLMLASMLLTFYEYNQLNSYIRDGHSLFPKDRWYGFKYFFFSKWKVAEVLAYFLLIVVLPIFHIITFYTYEYLPIHYGFVAFVVILLWTKVLFFAQAFRTTGTLVFMLENVIIDCMSFLMVALVVLVGFSIALFLVLQYVLKECSDQDSEVTQKITIAFGNPIKVLVSLVYVMLGLFDPKIFFTIGSLSPMVIIIFLSYLGVQMIIMLNMLIAIMSDTFDRVRNSEEEQNLKGKARFIDACEAKLSSNEIVAYNEKIGKYLFVLVPKDEKFQEDVVAWHGRVRTTEDNVQRIVKESEDNVQKIIKQNQEDIMEKMKIAKELLETTRLSLSEFEKRARNHAIEIEDTIKNTISAKFEFIEQYVQAKNNKKT